MALTGDLATMPLPDVLQFLGLGRKTGILHVENGSRQKRVAFEDGAVVFCSSGGVKEYLGQHLLARTAITEDALAAAFAEQETSGRPLGAILVEAGHLTQREMDVVLSRKIEDSIYDLFTWPAGKFEFEARPLVATDVPVRISLDWQGAVMEGCRRCDETALIRELLPGPGVQLHAVRSRFPQGFPATGGDRKLVALVGEGLTVGEICPRFHASDFDILRRLHELVRSGVFRVDEVTAEEARVPDSARELRQAQLALEQGQLVKALQLLRAGAQAWPDEPGFAAQLRLLEERIRADLESLGGPDVVPTIRIGDDRLVRVALTSQQGYVVSRINGTWTVRAIAQICPIDEVDVLATIEELARMGIVELTQPAGAGATPARGGRSGP